MFVELEQLFKPKEVKAFRDRHDLGVLGF